MQQWGSFVNNPVAESSSFDNSKGFLLKQRGRHNHQATMSNEDKQKIQEVDALLSEAMDALTFEERQYQQEILHGVGEDIAEEATFINRELNDLDEHLRRIKHGSMYEVAEKLDAMYVQARDFRLMFLRANRYDAKASANHMLRFFETKQDLFGTDKLAKDITIDDLDEDDRVALRMGSFQMAGRDTSNRQIAVHIPGVGQFKNLQNELRVRFYTTMQALESEQTQLNGIVYILYSVGDFKDGSNELGFMEHIRFALSVPQYNAAIHICFDDPSPCTIIKGGLAVLDARLRARVRVHFGSHVESFHSLSTYGIPKEMLPFTPSYELNMDHHSNWVESSLHSGNKKIDTAPEPDAVTETTPHDVLYRGGIKSSNRGNNHLRSLVAEWSQTYNSGTNDTKRCVVYEIADEIHRVGGRFLSKANGDSPWEAVPMDEVRLKITQMFRNYRRRAKGTRRKKSPPHHGLEDSIFER
ncbi:unnamed protein product [Cylindrotheca closterium]|uniref:DUF6824 domain-containing protein n=1 Tax=Cylindrotheca closterium TaxID=2856 RepID=A0AAD2FHT2_9STRA|nr:unnamed protein product [Cylindrotheca closterium]